MALVPATLAQQLFDAETAGVTLTAAETAKIQERCMKVAMAIDSYIKTATVNVTIQPLPLAGSAGPVALTGVAGPGLGISNSIV